MTGSAVFLDPAFPYLVTVRRDGEAYEITVEDTRKRWWGRVIERRQTTSTPVAGSGSQGLAYEALSMVERWLSDGLRMTGELYRIRVKSAAIPIQNGL